MYATLKKIGNHLDRRSGANEYASSRDATSHTVDKEVSLSGRCLLSPAASAWELYRRGQLQLTSGEVELVRNIKDVIASCEKRY
ncbi:hypothetical protein DQ04_03941050 [Trypanosoma grayi]|uniref:hypothetical protein n=1 Tax=Trypanosoma grayi TaxID=71804 RepID=UPI0004F46E48|nr:hypothetical protein DQ04_03941050 [Trypanosoma grayi]KEG10279.1 hypothetical protein DQ04_03941050 [Trypanosoma grayi]